LAEAFMTLTVLSRLILPVWLLLLTAITFQHLGVFPGLHLDEVWVGFRALEMQRQGLTDTTGMTWYSGSVFPYAISHLFDLFGPGVLSLRLLTALSFLSVLSLLGGVVWRYFGLWSALVLIALISQTLLFPWYGRIAWEVTAFVWLFFAVSISAVMTVLNRLEEVDQKIRHCR
jgi:hypothetical protein